MATAVRVKFAERDKERDRNYNRRNGHEAETWWWATLNPPSDPVSEPIPETAMRNPIPIGTKVKMLNVRGSITESRKMKMVVSDRSTAEDGAILPHERRPSLKPLRRCSSSSAVPMVRAGSGVNAIASAKRRPRSRRKLRLRHPCHEHSGDGRSDQRAVKDGAVERDRGGYLVTPNEFWNKRGNCRHLEGDADAKAGGEHDHVPHLNVPGQNQRA